MPEERPENQSFTARWARARARMTNLRERARARAAELRAHAQWPKKFPRIPVWAAITGGAAVVLALVIVFWDWNIIKGPMERYASAAAGRQVTIGGDVDVDLSWTTRVTAGRVSIANPEWTDGDMARIDRISFDVELLPLLLAGAVTMPQVEIDHPTLDLIREKGGRANWRFGEEGDGGEMQIPLIGRMLITNGRVHVTDLKHAMMFDGTVESREGPHGEASRAFVLKGRGTLDRKPFTATMTGDSPMRADRSHPYAFEARLTLGASDLRATGTLPRPFDLDQVAGALVITGTDMADLYHVTGLAFPNTPPYRLHGKLTRINDVWRVDGLTGLVGHTDVKGHMAVDATSDRPMLTADIASRKADVDDITTLFGAPPEVRAIPTPAAAARAANGAPPAQAVREERSVVAETISFLPDAPLRVERVREMDARVHYTAGAIATAGVPMKDLAVTVTLDHGVITVDPARVTLALGKLSGRARIDARRNMPDVDLNLRLADAKLEQFFHPASGGESPIAGVLEATTRLHGRGLSVRQAVANGSGSIGLAVPRGEIRKALAELLGINVLNGLGLMLANDDSTTNLRCAVADFHADSGALTVRRFVIDTDVMMATGSGRADLLRETLDLRLEGHPKKFRLGRIMAPITVSGKWAHPHIGIDAGRAVAQVGVAGLLGLLNPVAALIPFVTTGSQKDVDCARLLAGGSLETASASD